MGPPLQVLSSYLELRAGFHDSLLWEEGGGIWSLSLWAAVGSKKWGGEKKKKDISSFKSEGRKHLEAGILFSLPLHLSHESLPWLLKVPCSQSPFPLNYLLP